MGNRFPRIYLVYFFLFSSYFVPVLHTSDLPETYMLLSCIILPCSRQDSLSYSNRSLLRHLSSRHPCISLLYIMRLYMYLDTRTCNTGYCLLYLVCFYLQALAQFFKLLLSSIDYSSLDRQPLLRGYFDSESAKDKFKVHQKLILFLPLHSLAFAKHIKNTSISYH